MGGGRWGGRRRARAQERTARSPLTTGWQPPSAAGAVVVAAFARDRLGDGLAALHRAGFGTNARVLDGARGDLLPQLTRTGLPADLYPEPPDRGTALLLVSVPGREVAVGDLLLRAGAADVRVVSRGTTETKPEVPPLVPPGEPQETSPDASVG